MYNLTSSQKDLLRWLVSQVRGDAMPEEFSVVWGLDGNFLRHKNLEGFIEVEGMTEGAMNALNEDGLIHVRANSTTKSVAHCAIKGKAYEAVDSNFAAPDTSFVRHLTPLAEVTYLDAELRHRCLPILGAGAADPKLWDSAVRTAGVILEERLRSAGAVTDPQAVGRDLVNRVFGKSGTLSSKFVHDAEREGNRDIYAGVVGAFRNPSAHRLIDPTPHEGGAFIVFINLLLKKLDDLR